MRDPARKIAIAVVAIVAGIAAFALLTALFDTGHTGAGPLDGAPSDAHQTDSSR